MKRTDLAYIAGIIDGEGCIGVYRFHRKGQLSRLSYFRLQVVVSNTEQWLCEYLRMCFGGAVIFQDKGGNFKPIYRWSLYARQALEFLFSVKPYLHLKRPQAELAIEFMKGRNPRGRYSKDNAKRRAIEEAQWLTSKEYNQRGRSPEGLAIKKGEGNNGNE